MPDEDIMLPDLNYERISQTTIKQGFRISLPPELYEKTVFSVAEGDALFWSIDREYDHIILSHSPLKDSRYKTFLPTIVYDENTMKIPDKLDDSIIERYQPGTIVYFFAHTEMTTDPNPTIRLILWDQLEELLPGNDPEGLLDVPKFT